MPRAFDFQQVTADLDPLVTKLDFNLTQLASEIEEALAEGVSEFFTFLVTVVDDETGIDLSAWLPLVNSDINAIETLFGDLNPIGGSFNPVGAIEVFLQLIADNAETIVTQLPATLIQITGTQGLLNEISSALTGPEQLLDGFIADVPIINQIIPALGGTGTGITGLANAILSLPVSLINMLLSFLSGGAVTQGNLDDIPAALESLPGTIIADVEEALTNPGALLEGFVSDIPILNQLTSKLTVPASAITATNPNLLPNSIFDANSIAPNPDWLIDTTSTRTADGSGSVMITADGRPHALRSGRTPTDMIAMNAGGVLSVSIYALSQGYVAA